MNEYKNRASALHALIAMPPHIDQVIEELDRFNEQLLDPPLRLERADIRRALDALAGGDVTEAMVERWAETLHTAEDVELDPQDRDFLADALFELSTPELLGSMSDVVTGLQARVRSPRQD